MDLEDMTCLQVFNALTYALQSKTFVRDMPFVVFMAEYLKEDPDETPDTA